MKTKQYFMDLYVFFSSAWLKLKIKNFYLWAPCTLFLALAAFNCVLRQLLCVFSLFFFVAVGISDSNRTSHPHLAKARVQGGPRCVCVRQGWVGNCVWWPFSSVDVGVIGTSPTPQSDLIHWQRNSDFQKPINLLWCICVKWQSCKTT